MRKLLSLRSEKDAKGRCVARRSRMASAESVLADALELDEKDRARRLGGRARSAGRAWRKLHLVVAANTGRVVACDLSSNKARNAARVPALLKQLERVTRHECSYHRRRTRGFVRSPRAPESAVATFDGGSVGSELFTIWPSTRCRSRRALEPWEAARTGRDGWRFVCRCP